jgi:hypothetical protein
MHGRGEKKCTSFQWEGKKKREKLGRQRRRWDGIRMDLREMGLKGVNWMQLAQNMSWWQALVNTVTNLRVLAPHS